jgi:hypothetical protein
LKFSTAKAEENLKSLELGQLDLKTVTATMLDCLPRHHPSGDQKRLSDQRQLNLDRREQQDFCLLYVMKGALSADRLLPVVLKSVKLETAALKMQDLDMFPEFHALWVTVKTFGFWIMRSGDVNLLKISNLS